MKRRVVKPNLHQCARDSPFLGPFIVPCAFINLIVKDSVFDKTKEERETSDPDQIVVLTDLPSFRKSSRISSTLLYKEKN